MLRVLRLLIQGLFGLAAFFGRGRATHRRGVGAAGELRVVRSPTFPEHELFRAGRVFPVRLRHANLEADDDAAMDLRGASLKLADADEHAPLDLLLNTGEASLFRDVWVFLDFVRARPKGAAGFRWMDGRWPREWAAGAAGWRLGPSSYADLRYHSQIVTRFRGIDGQIRWVRYRMIPSDERPESGLPDAARLAHPISLDRRADDRRPKDYLRRELAERVEREPVRYRLQIQLHLPSVTDPPDLLDSTRTWPHPWHDLADVVLTRVLSDAETEALRFNVGRQPDSLGLLEPAGPSDYNAIGWLRTQVYPVSQLARTWRRSAPLLPQTEPTSWTALGRLLFDEPYADGGDKPLAHVDVELWDRDPLSADFLGRAETDEHGRFCVSYDPADAGPFDAPDLELRVVDPDSGRIIAVVPGADDVATAVYDFGTRRIRWWEYQPGPLARLWVPAGEDPPQDFAPGRRPILLRNLARGAATWLRHRATCLRDDLALTLDQIQGDYPPTPPILLERDQPGSTRTDAYLVDRVLNGFYPAPLEPDGPGRWQVRYLFDADQHNGVYDLANVRATFAERAGTLVPEGITLRYRQPGALDPHGPLADPIEVRPGDERWAAAKRIFTTSHLVAGEVDGHLCRAHIDVEQYAVAAFRNLRRSPLLGLLAPHLKEVATINWQGQAWVYGDSGIVPRISGLTPRAVGERFVDQMGRVDWRDWAPPRPIGPGHRWAHVAGLFWELLGRHFDAAIHRHRDGIAAAWSEVRGFSRDLAERSAPYTGPEADDGRVWSRGARRAVHPFATSARPDDEDLVRLRDVCRYAVFRATLWHSWINDKQEEDGGDVRIGTLGLRNGGFGPDPEVGALPAHASEQLYLVSVLVGTGYGYLLRNEDGDVPVELIDRIRQSGPAFAAHGFDVENIRSRVNI